MRDFKNHKRIFENVLDDIERSESGRSSGIIAANHLTVKDYWSVYLTICIGKILTNNSEL